MEAALLKSDHDAKGKFRTTAQRKLFFITRRGEQVWRQGRWKEKVRFKRENGGWMKGLRGTGGKCDMK